MLKHDCIDPYSLKTSWNWILHYQSRFCETSQKGPAIIILLNKQFMNTVLNVIVYRSGSMRSA